MSEGKGDEGSSLGKSQFCKESFLEIVHLVIIQQIHISPPPQNPNIN